MLDAVDTVNVSRGRQAVSLVEESVGGVAGKQVAVWGATFNPGTDDVRDSVGLLVASHLNSLGAMATVYDPMGTGNAFVAFPELTYADTALAAAAGAEVVVVGDGLAAVRRHGCGRSCGGGRWQGDRGRLPGISASAWREAGWQVRSLTGVSVADPVKPAGASLLSEP